MTLEIVLEVTLGDANTAADPRRADPLAQPIRVRARDAEPLGDLLGSEELRDHDGASELAASVAIGGANFLSFAAARAALRSAITRFSSETRAYSSGAHVGQ